MKIAVAIIIITMVARAQGLRCAICVHQTGEEIIHINMAKATDGKVTEQDCKPTSVFECTSDNGDVCASVFMTFTTTVDGQTKEDYTNFFNCISEDNLRTEQDRIEACTTMEMIHKNANAGITDFTCRLEICLDDGCNLNYEKEDEKEDEKESDAKSYVSSETRAGTSIFLVGIFSFLI